METYRILFNHGPLTANQLMKKAKELCPNKTHQALESLGRRLSELRNSGVVIEVSQVICPITERPVILWDVTRHLPEKRKKPHKIKCKHCNGRGYFEQAVLL